jgi:O-antigen/teichoic acid export membrane protein
MNTSSFFQSMRRDSSWSALSFLLIVVSGLLLNAGLAQSFGRPGLGLFNTCLSVVLIVGQLGGLGINAAVAFEVPSAKSQGQPHQHILRTALLSTFMTSSVVAVLLISAVELLISNDDSGYLSGLRLSYLAVFLLPFNKVLIAYLNGTGDIKKAALVNAFRFILMLSFLGIATRLEISWKTVPVIISLAEFFLLAALVWVNKASLLGSVKSAKDNKTNQKSIMSFGIRSIPAVFLLDINTRVDVLLLSLLKGSEVVGQYTVASTFSEGLFQMAMVTRLVVDPRIASFYASGMTLELSRFLKRHIGLTYMVMIPIIGASIFLYTPVVDLLFSKENASGSLEVFVFLAFGVLLASGFIPLTNLLNQMGDPWGQSLLLTCLTGINIGGNLLLIPSMGASGAALATALSQALFVPMLLVLVNRRQQISIWKPERNV